MDPVAKDKRIKREIANSNERRRMQSINAGFQKLKRLLPVNDGEKISKANILQHAADYITSIERDRIALYEQNTLFRRILIDLKSGKIDTDSAATSLEANASSMLTVPLNLQVTLASANSTPASTPTPTPRTSPTTPTSATVPASTTKPTSTTTVSLKNPATTTATTATTTVIVPISAHSNNSIQSTPIKPATKTAARATKPQRRQSIRNSVNKINNNNNQLDNSRGNNNNNANINHNNNNTNDNNQNIGSVAEIISDKIVSPKNGLTVPGAVAKAAIALPLEVPYTSEIVIKPHHQHHHHHHHQHESNSDPMTAPRKLLKTETTATSAAIESQDVPKGQTLDTICKAIMEIEGDRVFKNEKIEQHDAT